MMRVQSSWYKEKDEFLLFRFYYSREIWGWRLLNWITILIEIRLGFLYMGIYRTRVRVLWVKAYPGPSSKRGKDSVAHNWSNQTLSIQRCSLNIY